MAQLVPPHKSEEIKPLLLPQTQRSEVRKRSDKLKKIPLDSRAGSDLFRRLGERPGRLRTR